ncbi:transcriptional repressor CTCFL-like [Nilaparvata lugens]|uniref:transcriptional repressor CTCFL-like n=1 Tax=Nilaparvata lugens TaxID=108931 RepID=UPI00193E0807|nr:transcriptional repressor CTCFL-like [Nilaparvata lugens]
MLVCLACLLSCDLAITFICLLPTDYIFQDDTQSSAPPISSADQVFSCPKCAKSYKALSSLKRHVNYECGIDPQFQCRICGKRCKQKTHLKRHILDMHTEGVESFSCPLCNYKAKRKSNLKIHIFGVHAKAVAALQSDSPNSDLFISNL